MTLSGEQALDLRKFEALTQNLPPDLNNIYIQHTMRMFLSQGLQFGSTIRKDAPGGESDELEQRINEFLRNLDQDVNEVN